jgi:uncharacterized protein
MPVAVTALYGGILGLLIVALGLNVSRHRTKLGVMFGDDGNLQLRRVIRLHGNTVETAPIAVLLMGLYELDGGSKAALHAAGIALILGRLMYAGGLVWNKDDPSAVRATGITVTWLTIAALAVLNLWQIG